MTKGKKMKRNSRNHWVLFAVLLLATIGVPAAQAQTDLAQVEAAAAGVPIRWDIIKITNFTPTTITSGGSATAKAVDGSQITLTGTGTFLSSGENILGVTGGGTWATVTALGAQNGTYIVTELISFTPAPGALPAAAVDQIGNSADSRSGLAVLRVRYSDGTRGVIAVSCDLPVGTPAIIVEGITATKDFANFYNVQTPVAAVDGNRTAFHVLSPTDTSACSPSAIALCLGGRFKVQVSGPGITGFAIPNTADTGDFWFYSPNNIDVVVKVLDGRTVNNRFWVFIGSLSDRAYTVTVTDTATGAVRTYTNPPGTIADTSAF